MKGITVETSSKIPILTKDEVWQRLLLCTRKEVIEEIYVIGQSISKDIYESIHTLDSKAISFAAYAGAIITLLASSFSKWSSTSVRCGSWISVAAGMSALVCVVFAVKSLSFKPHEIISQEDWLKREYLQNEMDLRRYHIFAIWGVMENSLIVQRGKVKDLRHALHWLKFSGVFLVLLLFNIAFVNSGVFAIWNGFMVKQNMASKFGGFGAASFCILALLVTLFLAVRGDRRI